MRHFLVVIEVVLFSALILATRCANYQEVFVNGTVCFTDADCYSRMTRARMCAEQPGLIIRHHSFENFPVGTTPHTTALFDYLIVALARCLKPWTTHPLDLAGAFISPLLGLLGGWFLWWWSRRMQLPYRGALLLLYALSPIVVHGTELGRPDHQSLMLVLVLVAICAEWSLQSEQAREWSAASGVAWGLALWVSFYEPLVLLAVLVVSLSIFSRRIFTAPHRRIGWILLLTIVALSFVIERRFPLWPTAGDTVFANWSSTIGELKHVPVMDKIWLRWAGLLLLPAPVLLWLGLRQRSSAPAFIVALLFATFALTLWQARWAYFFVAIFALALPTLPGVIHSRVAVWIVLAFSMFPILQGWDETLWPNEAESARRMERRIEAVQWREAANSITSPGEAAFLAPWWWSPAVAYWSGQPGVAGSSHEALDGIARSARFFLASDAGAAGAILRENKVAWVLAYDAERTAANSATILGIAVPAAPLCYVLDRTPAQAPSFLKLSAQNAAAKVFRVDFSGEKNAVAP